MESVSWVTSHWFELIQTVGIIGSFLFSGYSAHKEAEARRISNLLAIGQQHHEIWKEAYKMPELSRVFERNRNLSDQPVSSEEWLFVKQLILHLGSVHQAMAVGMFVRLDGLRRDVQEFFAAPIPRIVWAKLKSTQDAAFISFVESCLPS